MELGRNEPCHCGSGKKYKKCCLEKDEGKNRKEREKAALNAAKVMAAEAKEAEEKGETKGAAPHGHEQPNWMSKMAGKMGMFRGQQRRQTPQNKGG
jgi:hypothetical protein